MAQVQVREFIGNDTLTGVALFVGLPGMPVRIAAGSGTSDEARDDKSTDGAGNCSFPFREPSPDDTYTLHVNMNPDQCGRGYMQRFHPQSVRVTGQELSSQDIAIVMERLALSFAPEVGKLRVER